LTPSLEILLKKPVITGAYELLHGEYELHVGGRAPGYAPSEAVGEPLRTVLRVV